MVCFRPSWGRSRSKLPLPTTTPSSSIFALSGVTFRLTLNDSAACALLAGATVKIAALAASTFRPRPIPEPLQAELKKNLPEQT